MQLQHITESQEEDALAQARRHLEQPARRQVLYVINQLNEADPDDGVYTRASTRQQRLYLIFLILWAAHVREARPAWAGILRRRKRSDL